MKVSEGLVSSESFLLGLADGCPSVSPHMVTPLCMHLGVSACVLTPLLTRTPVRLD